MITPEQFVAILGSLTALVGAIAAAVYQLHSLRKDINGRMSQLVEQTAAASQRLGELKGRDFHGTSE